ncbi:PEK/GCN2 protein kinase Gcn2 [Schizosaccharomyces japonicus yFS275]|uniref:non-specific serine/threonine protein kinase n=1 Tax=Schizosaccharomyces japonicus (strain yFS275 / FY16936) TaxID=402676 RepID=B6JXM9_SCHJY|nr:PEK/GCN2 protein kinase Gcn2 [Schizosaccharomyces japonicus yFS275]EEB05173.1 PEK/GCN2 protein kinase Gcn2 [Schizosaccharomyces japonicus yFS275]
MDTSQRQLFCEESQKNELEALEAIFMDDLEKVNVNNAWNVSNQNTYVIHLCSRSNSAKNIAKIDFEFELGRSYPYNKPVIRLKNGKNVLNSQVRFLLSQLDRKSRELVGQEMIFELASMVQDYLNDWQSELSSQFASLEEERAVKLKEDREKASQDQAMLRKKEEDERQHEQMLLNDRIHDELQRRSYERGPVNTPRNKKTNGTQTAKLKRLPHTIDLECEVSVKDTQDAMVTFSQIRPVFTIAETPLSTLTAVKPVVHDTDVENQLFALRTVLITNEYWSTETGKKSLQTLEKELQSLCGVRHELLASIYENQLERIPSAGWRLYVLQEYAPRLTLHSLLQTVLSLDVDTVRSYASNILEGLNELHRLGMAHKDLHAGNVLLVQSGQRTYARLSDFSYMRTLRDMNSSSSFTDESVGMKTNFPTGLFPPEVSDASFALASRKTDIWCFGLVVIQMLCGLHVFEKFNTAKLILNRVLPCLHKPFQDLLSQCLMHEMKKRPTASELLSSHAIRLGTALITSKDRQIPPKGMNLAQLSLQENIADALYKRGISRYESDFEEIEFLGKGGFGEVVKVKNRIDGRFYAIKKLPLNNSASGNNKILKEVMTLSRLHHEHVVRYYTAWVETETHETLTEMLSSEEDSLFSSANVNSDLLQSTSYAKNGLSSLDIHFDEESSSSSEDEDDVVFEGDGTASSTSSSFTNDYISTQDTSQSEEQSLNVTLYIQMEYCEKLSLQDIIRDKLPAEEIWRLFRQILEALTYINSRGMMHRDLKPGNVFLDENRNVKLGDFGLATENEGFQDPALVKWKNKTIEDGEMTAGVGTALYVAPELLNKSTSTHYDAKVDMYSLGIILFEMCCTFSTAMERIRMIEDIRLPSIRFPSSFPYSKTSNESRVITWLLQHDPKKRPSSQELSESDLVPAKVEDEYIREGLRVLSNPHTPYYSRLLKVLFNQSIDKHIDYTYDFYTNKESGMTTRAFDRMLDPSLVGFYRDRAVQVFKRHGAKERKQTVLFPKTNLYTQSQPLVKLLDSNGTLLQLPYDNVLPYAREVARSTSEELKTYLDSHVYRELPAGGRPFSVHELSFDIASYSDHLEWYDAEVMKVIDELMSEFPSLQKGCIRINHADIFNAIMEYLKVDREKRARVSTIISQVSQNASITRIRNQLRSEFLVPSTTLDELLLFDYCLEFEEGVSRLLGIFDSSLKEKVMPAINNLRQIMSFAKELQLSFPVYFAPLCVYNLNFYTGGVMFQAINTIDHSDVVIAGGRYDALVRQYDPPLLRTARRKHAVGITVALEKLVHSMTRYVHSSLKKSMRGKKFSTSTIPLNNWIPRRLDVIVASIGKDSLTEKCAVLRILWALNIKADVLHKGATSLEEVVTRFRNDGINWVLVVRQKNTAMQNSIKVRNISKGEDYEIRTEEIGLWMLSEINERKRLKNTKQTTELSRTSSQEAFSQMEGQDLNLDVQLVSLKDVNDRKYKWKHKMNAMNKVYDLVKNAISDCSTDAVALAVDCSTEVMHNLRSTTLQNEESWKRFIDSSPASQRQYLEQLHQKLLAFKEEGKQRVWVASFRTNELCLYELNE